MGDGVLTWLLWLIPLAGVAAVYFGWRGRRVGSEPRCSECEYILVGSDGPWCPECGAVRMPEATVYGEHRRRPLLLVTGVVLLLVSAGMGVRLAIRPARWYANLPTWWVISELGNDPDAHREISARIRAGELSDGQWQRLIERALDEQLASKPDGAVIDLLRDAAAAGKMSPEQCQRLLDQGTELKIRTRDPIREWAPLHAVVGVRSRCPAYTFGQTVWLRCIVDKVECDGEDRGVHGIGVGMLGISDGRSGAGLDLGSSGARGRHQLRVTGHVDLVSGPYGNGLGGTILATRPVTAEAVYEAAAPEQAPRIRTIEGPERDEQFQRGMRIERLRYTKQRRLEGKLAVEAPFPVAVRVTLKGPDGKELAAGGAAVNASRISSILSLPISAPWPGEPPSTVNVILRSSVENAASSIDMDEVYVGEVELKDVPVEVE